MIFGRIAVVDAEGAILAHSVRLPGRAMKKGRLLSAEDVDALLAAGTVEVVAAQFETDDIPEDTAATTIARAACGDGVTQQAAFTGRCNVYADMRGIAVIDRARVDRLNAVDEAVTIATVAPFDLVEPGQMLATIKIIPFAAPRKAVDEATGIAAEAGPLVRVAPLAAHDVGIILTRLPGTKESVLDKTVAVLTQRLQRLDSSLKREIRCDHDHEAVASAVREALAAGCSPVLIFGASAITDRLDEVPAGIVLAGGTVDHFGMPVDPGNLLLLARHGEVPVIGLPGCARSPKLNGFDWVLQRLLADIPVTRHDIMGMGAGGLLTEISTRPQPRAGDGQTQAPAPRAPRITAIVLAAGQSRRMGRANKLLAAIDGVPMVVRAVDTALAAQVEDIVVVTGHEADAIQSVLTDRAVRFVHNDRYAEGLSTSLKAGLRALPETSDGVVVLLGDMPRIKAAHVNRLVAAFNPLEGRAICVPTNRGKRGNPVLFASHFAAEMIDLAGDVGAKHLIGLHADAVAEVPIDDDGIFIDVDTPEALTALTEGAA